MQRVLVESDRVNRKWESELMMEGADKRHQEKRGYEVALHLISKELDAEGQPIGEQRAAALLAELGADEVIGITPAQLQQACWKVQCLQNPALEAHLEAGKAEVAQALQQAGLEPVDPQEYHQQAAALIQAGGRYPVLKKEIEDNERILQRNPDIAKMELGDAKERLKKCERRVADLEKPSMWERFKAFVKGPSCAEKLQSYQTEAEKLRPKVNYEEGIQEKNELDRNGRQLLDQVRDLQARNLAVARIENQVKAAQIAQFQQQQLQQQNQIAQNQNVAVSNQAAQHVAEGVQQGVPDQAHQQKMKNVMEELQGVKAQKEKQYKPGQTGVALASSNAKSQQQQIKNELQELESKKMVSKTKL